MFAPVFSVSLVCDASMFMRTEWLGNVSGSGYTELRVTHKHTSTTYKTTDTFNICLHFDITMIANTHILYV